MTAADERGPVRLAILICSIAGLVLLGVKTVGGTEGASASRRAAARDHSPGKIVAIVARRRLPLSIRRQVGPPSPTGVATVQTTQATYLLGGIRPGPGGSSLPTASVLRRTDGAPSIRVAKLPVAVRDAAAEAVGDRLYVFGGRLAGGKPTDLIQEYDVATERSVVAGRLPMPVASGAALALNGFVYLAGGRVNGSPTRAIVRFDPWSGRTVIAGRLPVPASGGVAAASRSRRGYLVGARAPGVRALNFEITVR
jgi:Kelch motif